MAPNTWAMACHLLGLTGYATGFGGIIAPLVVWVAKKDEVNEVDFHGKEAINFNLLMLVYGILLIVPSALTLGLGAFILYPALVVFHVIFTILASLKANDGIPYRYPFCIRFIA